MHPLLVNSTKIRIAGQAIFPNEVSGFPTNKNEVKPLKNKEFYVTL